MGARSIGSFTLVLITNVSLASCINWMIATLCSRYLVEGLVNLIKRRTYYPVSRCKMNNVKMLDQTLPNTKSTFNSKLSGKRQSLHHLSPIFFPTISLDCRSKVDLRWCQNQFRHRPTSRATCSGSLQMRLQTLTFSVGSPQPRTLRTSRTMSSTTTRPTRGRLSFQHCVCNFT